MRKIFTTLGIALTTLGCSPAFDPVSGVYDFVTTTSNTDCEDDMIGDESEWQVQIGSDSTMTMGTFAEGTPTQCTLTEHDFVCESEVFEEDYSVVFGLDAFLEMSSDQTGAWTTDETFDIATEFEGICTGTDCDQVAAACSGTFLQVAELQPAD